MGDGDRFAQRIVRISHAQNISAKKLSVVLTFGHRLKQIGFLQG